MKVFALLLLSITLMGCGNNNVTQEDLQANQWTVDVSHIEPKTPLVFDVEVHDQTIELTAHPDSVSDTYTAMTGDNSKAGRDMAALQSYQFNQTLDYTFNTDGINLAQKDWNLYVGVKAEKSDDNIIITLQENEENEELTQMLLSETDLKNEHVKLTLMKK